MNRISIQTAYERAHPRAEKVERVYVQLQRGFGGVYHVGAAVQMRREWLIPEATEYVLEYRGPTLCGKAWARHIDTATMFPPSDKRLCRICERRVEAAG